MTTTRQHQTTAAAGRPGPLRDTGPAPARPHPGLAASLRPLLIDIGVPVGGYYLLRDGGGGRGTP
jgi:hypothetical protein